MKKEFILKTLFWLVLLFLVLVYNEYARIGLPDARKLGNKDDQSIALFILGFVLFFSYFRALLSRILIIVLFTVIFVFTVANWWFFDFYRDYLTIGAIKLAIYSDETSMAWDGLKFKKEALLYFMGLSGLIVTLFFLNNYKPKRKTLLISSSIVFILAIQQQVVVANRVMGGLGHHGVNHISYFIKSIFPKEKIKITDNDIALMKLALPEKNIASSNKKFPLFVNEKISKHDGQYKNVILIVMESVRLFETGLYEGSNDSITPNLDKLAESSINYTNHYANSNQTVRSELAILCSALDYINGAPYAMSGQHIETNCIPSILSEVGYETYWFHGYKKKFFNREEFFPKIGFQHIIDLSELKKAGLTKEIGWGISDEEVFGYAIDKLESENKPFFAEIMTLSNHFPYLWDWGIPFSSNLKLDKKLNEESDNVYPAYKRGIHYTDYALGLFLDRFKKSSLYDNTLLIVTGDHGIWLFPDELTKDKSVEAEIEKNEKYFRLPLLIHAKDIKKQVNDLPVSHVDLAPTILDYLGITYPNSFFGASLLAREDAKNYPVYFLASGGYGARKGDQYCYPVDTSNACNDHYRKCESYKKSESTLICAKTKNDLLESTDNIDYIGVNQDADAAVINMSQYYLEYGFMNKADVIR